MKTLTYPSYGIAASAAARALKDHPDLTVQIDPIAIGFALTLHRPKPMKIRLPRRIEKEGSDEVSRLQKN